MRRLHLILALGLGVTGLVAPATAGQAADTPPAGCAAEPPSSQGSGVVACSLGPAGTYSFTVPADPGPLAAFVQSADGGSYGAPTGPFPGGESTQFGATFPVRAGDVVTLRVGGVGADRKAAGGTAAGGLNGGGPGGAHGAGGGGWTGLSITRGGKVVGLAVAGGGGGAVDGDPGFSAVPRGQNSDRVIDASTTAPGWRPDAECPECAQGAKGAAQPAFSGAAGGSGGSGVPADGGGGGGGYFGGGGGLTDQDEPDDAEDDGTTNEVVRTGGGGGSSLVTGASAVDDSPWKDPAIDASRDGFGHLRLEYGKARTTTSAPAEKPGKPRSPVDGVKVPKGYTLVQGTPGADHLRGTAAREFFLGGAGNDTIDGGGGNDILRGGPGDDTLDGGPGNDRLFGERGDDVLKGRRGNDRLSGGPGKDVLSGGQGKDTVDGGPGKDKVRAAGGDRVRRV